MHYFLVVCIISLALSRYSVVMRSENVLEKLNHACWLTVQSIIVVTIGQLDKVLVLMLAGAKDYIFELLINGKNAQRKEITTVIVKLNRWTRENTLNQQT